MFLEQPHAHYHALIAFCEKKKLYDVPGDFVEVGALFGSGTRILASYLKRFCRDKKLYVIDVFDLDFDATVSSGGLVMKELYNTWLKDTGIPSQWLLYLAAIHGLGNVVTLREDSRKVVLPARQVAFAFIDGNHSAEYVESDFNMIWERLAPGGSIAFHDYGGDLPHVTAKIDELVTRHRSEIAHTGAVPKAVLYFLTKRADCRAAERAA